MPELRTIEGVELARTGTYRLSTGEQTFTRDHLSSAVTAAEAGAAPRLRIGHIDPRFDGDPAIGSVKNLRLDQDGDLLVGDLVDVPEWLAENLPAIYPGRSIEAKVTEDTMRLTGLALLGVTAPGIDALADLERLVAATGGRAVFASGQDAAGVDVTVALPAEPSSPAAPAAPTTPPPAGPTQEDATVDIAALRTTLGLPDDASQETIDAKLAELNARPTPEAVAEQIAAAGQAPDGVVTVEASALDALKADAAAGRAARDAQVKAEDVAYVAAAAEVGKIPAARSEHFVTLMEVDREGTRAVLDGLEENVVPVAASGTAIEPAGDGVTDAEYAAYIQAKTGKEVTA